MLDTLTQWDTSLFLFLNGHNSPFWDSVMLLISGKLTWIPLYLLLIYFIIRRYRVQSIWWLLAIAILVLITDQASVKLFKNVFLRLRPCHTPDLSGLVHLVGRCGGKYGFVSSHAANTFGVAVFLSFLFSKRWVSISILLWALVVSYSRIYLGVHFPGDIICGAILGAGIAIAVWLPAVWFFRKKIAGQMNKSQT